MTTQVPKATNTLSSAASAIRADNSVYKRRRVVNVIALTLAGIAVVFGLFWLAWILITLFKNGFAALSPLLFTADTPPPGSDGGLRNAIVGSMMMVGLGTVIGTPVGILAGTYIAEYGKTSWLARVTRFINDILLSAPSIIIGLFVYTVIVANAKQYSGYAGSVALAIIIIPVVVRTTDDMLQLVPVSLREAAMALGAPMWKMVTAILYRSARAGILTGVLLGVARIAGETAPLLFTALNNQFFSVKMGEPMANLPVVMFQFAMSPYSDWQRLAWGAAILVTLSVLLINILARILLKKEVQR